MKVGLLLLSVTFMAMPALAAPPASVPSDPVASVVPGSALDPTPAEVQKTRTKSNNCNERAVQATQCGAAAPVTSDHAINTKGMGANDRQPPPPVTPQR